MGGFGGLRAREEEGMWRVWCHPSSNAIMAVPSLHIALPSMPSPFIPTMYTYRSSRRKLCFGSLLNGGVCGEVHVGIHGALGLDQVRVSSAFGHVCCLGLVTRGAAEPFCNGDACEGKDRKGVEMNRRVTNEAWCVYPANVLRKSNKAGKTQTHSRCCGSVEGHGKCQETCVHVHIYEHEYVYIGSG